MTRKKSAYRRKTPTQIKLAPLTPSSENQAELIDSIREEEQTFAIGPAGTGKTYVTVRMAAEAYDRGEVDTLVITRPNIPAGRSLGAFKGTMADKIEEWIKPVTDILSMALGKSRLENDTRAGNIIVVPFEVMRGRTFDNAFVILDEAQNTTPNEMFMFLTRLGEGTKSVITGDLRQSDLSGESGLSAAINLAETHDIPVGIVEFGVEDIVRSGLCKEWVRAIYYSE